MFQLFHGLFGKAVPTKKKKKTYKAVENLNNLSEKDWNEKKKNVNGELS